MNTLDLALAVLRLGVGLIFAAHGAQKLFGWWGGPGMTGWTGAMQQMGFRPAALFAWASALVELVGGLLLAVGLGTPIAAAAVIAQSVVIIGHVHWSKGFFNGKGGYEFPLILGAGALATLLAGPGSVSLDGLLGLGVSDSVRAGLVGAGLAAGLLALALPRLQVQPAGRDATR